MGALGSLSSSDVNIISGEFLSEYAVVCERGIVRLFGAPETSGHSDISPRSIRILLPQVAKM